MTMGYACNQQLHNKKNTFYARPSTMDWGNVIETLFLFFCFAFVILATYRRRSSPKTPLFKVGFSALSILKHSRLVV